MKTKSNRKKFFLQIRLKLLELFIGHNSCSFIETSLKEHDNLTNFQPTNIFQELMTKPSDIYGHLNTLYMLTIENDLKTVLELGTAEGESTIALLKAVSHLGGKVHSIDIKNCLQAQAIVEKNGLTKFWIFMQNDDLKVNWSQTIDHLFIDTSHLYDHTLKELEKYEPFVKEGGIITLHDIVSFPEVMLAIQDYTKGRDDLRVYTYLHNNGLAVIFKGKTNQLNGD